MVATARAPRLYGCHVDPTLATLPPVVSLTVGVAGTLLVERLRDRRLEQREAHAQQEERDRTRSDRREAFELENLQSLIAATDELLRASYVHYLLDRGAAVASDTLYASHRTDSLPGALEVGERLRLAHVAIYSRIALLASDELRQDYRNAVGALNEVAFVERSIKDADSAQDSAASAVKAVQLRPADRVRQIYLER